MVSLCVFPFGEEEGNAKSARLSRGTVFKEEERWGGEGWDGQINKGETKRKILRGSERFQCPATSVEVSFFAIRSMSAL